MIPDKGRNEDRIGKTREADTTEHSDIWSSKIKLVKISSFFLFLEASATKKREEGKKSE
jgi:hypothetical protein